MGHYAKIEGEEVVHVIVATSEFFETFVDTDAGQWIKTSYNTRGGIHYDPVTGEVSNDQSKALRKNFAAVGFIYDRERDAFIPPKPFQSWVLNEDTCLWNAPTPKPQDGSDYSWNEETLSWEVLTPDDDQEIAT